MYMVLTRVHKKKTNWHAIKPCIITWESRVGFKQKTGRRRLFRRLLQYNGIREYSLWQNEHFWENSDYYQWDFCVCLTVMYSMRASNSLIVLLTAFPEYLDGSLSTPWHTSLGCRLATYLPLVFFRVHALENIIWAGAWQNKQNDLCAQRRLRVWVVRWVRMSFCWFCHASAEIETEIQYNVMRRPNFGVARPGASFIKQISSYLM